MQGLFEKPEKPSSEFISTLGTRVGRSLISRPHGFLIFLYDISTTNLFTAALALVLVSVLLAALLHRLVWPAISRPVYVAHRYGLVMQHTLLTTLGATCLVLAWPNNPLVKAIENGDISPINGLREHWR